MAVSIYYFLSEHVSEKKVMLHMYVPPQQEGPMAHSGSIIAAGLGRGRVRMPCRNKRVSVWLLTSISNYYLRFFVCKLTFGQYYQYYLMVKNAVAKPNKLKTNFKLLLV